MDPDESKPTSYSLLFVLCIAVVAVYVIYWSWLTFAVPVEDRGAFGDMFGGLSALFNALAFSGLIFTAILQRNELELQRKELRGQREVFLQQNFDSTFFQLLRLHHEIVGAMLFPSSTPGKEIIGRATFKVFRSAIEAKYLDIAPHVLHAEEDLKAVRTGYQAVYQKHQAHFGHYFRNLYHIIKFVHESEISDKSRYTALVRAQLSTDELACLFYNCLSAEGSEKFKPLAETYALFNNLPYSALIREYHKDYVAAQAFG